MSTQFKFDPSKLEKGLGMFQTKADQAIWMYAETSALLLQNDARKNASWTDRTGEARKRLVGSVTTLAKGYRLNLAHGVNYGLWLELADEKKYSVIQPTIDTTGATKIMPGFKSLITRLKGV